MPLKICLKDTIQIRILGIPKMMKLSFPYNQQLIEQIKTIPQRSWNPNDKTWEIPDEFLATAINYIRPHYPDVAQGL